MKKSEYREITVNRDDCMLWAGGKDSKYGYGSITVNGRSRGVHRVFYEHWVGPIEDGLVIDHLCTTPPCFNPEHLEPVTQIVNSQRTFGVGLCMNGHSLDKTGYLYTLKNGRVTRQCKACKNAVATKRYYKVRKEPKPMKITATQAVNIRHMKDEVSGVQIARMYGITPSYVSLIILNKWRKQETLERNFQQLKTLDGQENTNE